MQFAPIAPYQHDGSFSSKIAEMATELITKSASLSGGHTPQTLEAVKELLYYVNCYYSNNIESQGTKPSDIERAMKKEFSENVKERNLQILALAHLNVQRWIENKLKSGSISPYDETFIHEVHKHFYEVGGMEPFQSIEHQGILYPVMPGLYRDKEVEVGRHLAPAPVEVPGLMATFESLYNAILQNNIPSKVIHALSSHHRFVWIHPFMDGNGRVSRLILDAAMKHSGILGYGLWSISRGLSRSNDRYKEYLSIADQKQIGAYDGRGPLSTKALEEFVEFMLSTCLDQINYMSRYLRMDTFASRIEDYIARSQKKEFDNEPLPDKTSNIINMILLKGECQRGELSTLTSIPDRTMTRILKKLLEQNILQSDSQKGPVRLKISAHMSGFLFPEI